VQHGCRGEFGGHGCLEFHSAGFEFLELLLDPGRLQPAGDGLDEVRELALDPLQLPLTRPSTGGRFRGETVPFLDKGRAELGHQRRLHQP